MSSIPWGEYTELHQKIADAFDMLRLSKIKDTEYAPDFTISELKEVRDTLKSILDDFEQQKLAEVFSYWEVSAISKLYRYIRDFIICYEYEPLREDYIKNVAELNDFITSQTTRFYLKGMLGKFKEK